MRSSTVNLHFSTLLSSKLINDEESNCLSKVTLFCLLSEESVLEVVSNGGAVLVALVKSEHSKDLLSNHHDG